jgi:HK97 gp10 family phage protein
MALTRVNIIASKGSFKLEGVDTLKKALDILGTEIATKEGKRANRRAAVGMSKVMKANAPVSAENNRSPASKKYGRLRDNIRVRLAKSRVQTAIVYNVTVGRAFWGFFQEFGTKNMTANPWMRSSFDSSVNAARTDQIDELKKGVERAAKRAYKASGGK